MTNYTYLVNSATSKAESAFNAAHRTEPVEASVQTPIGTVIVRVAPVKRTKRLLPGTQLQRISYRLNGKLIGYRPLYEALGARFRR